MSTERFELIAPCHFRSGSGFGKREIRILGYEISKVEDGKVTFLADARELQMPMFLLRTTERILLKVAEVKAETLMSFSRQRKLCHGNVTFLQMANSGLRKPIQ